MQFVPSCGYFTDFLKDHKLSRQHYFDKLWSKVAGVDLVFFDPDNGFDNGFEVATTKFGKRNSSKYLYWPEATQCYEMGSSLLVYQHFCRQKRDAFIGRIARKLHQHTHAKTIISFRTPQVVFFLVPQTSISPILNSRPRNWRGGKIRST